MILAIAFALLQLGDFLSTMYVLNRGGKELNPLLNAIPLPTLVTVALKCIILSAFALFFSAPDEVLAILCLVYVWVIIHNMRYKRKSQ